MSDSTAGRTPTLASVRSRKRSAKRSSNTSSISVKALRLRTVLREEMRRVFQVCDVVALPVANPAPRLEPELQPTDPASQSPSAPTPETFSIGNMTGIPAIVQPCGFTTGPPSLPVGIQFYAKPFDEATLFRVSHAYESATDWHTRRPPLAG